MPLVLDVENLMKRFLVVGSISLASLLLSPAIVSAQSNPFAPRANSGLTKAEVEAIARKAAEDRAKQSAESGNPSPAPATPDQGNPAAGLPSQPGVPSGSPVGPGAPMGPQQELDPIAALMAEDGVFVGCVRNVPIFKDKMGRRIYFTTKELKDSMAARRFARC